MTFGHVGKTYVNFQPRPGLLRVFVRSSRYTANKYELSVPPSLTPLETLNLLGSIPFHTHCLRKYQLTSKHTKPIDMLRSISF